MTQPNDTIFTGFYRDWQPLLATMAEGAAIFDREGRIRLWNPAIARITGYTEEEALGRHFTWLHSETCCDWDNVTQILHPEFPRPSCSDNHQCYLRSSKGTEIPVMINTRALPDHDGRYVGILQTVTDMRRMGQLEYELQRLRRRQSLPESFYGMIGQDKSMQELYRLLELAADSDATVFIQGESGTGKELAANAIHEAGHRAVKPFVKVNCGALPESILESELFGHVKGAFTGAYRDRAGRFEVADGGTIFLDEITEISQAVQIKLLRVLQDQEFERVGDSATRKVDVRVIAASNRNLNATMRAGEFRQDLYYRLRVFPIHIPPLRDRPDDVPLLVRHFIDKFANKTGKDIRELDADATRAIMDYCWPGNIRELENAIEHAFVTCRDTSISLFDLPQELRRYELRREVCNTDHAPENAETATTPVSSGQAQTSGRHLLHKREDLEKVLQESGWNKAEAARRLGVSRTAVWQWMKKHDIPLT